MTRFIWLMFIILLIGCSENATETPEDIVDGPPRTPQMHLHQRDLPDDLWGPDALTDTDGIHIEWEANTEDDLAGYNIYRAIAPSEASEKIDSVAQNFTFYEDTDVRLEIRYCYRVTAVDEMENESTRSESACYTLIRKLVLIEPANQAILTELPTFRWLGIGETGFYIVRVFIDTGNAAEPFREIWHYETVNFDQFEITYNQDGRATETLIPGQQYRWRVDFEAQQTVGSESNWRFFTIQP